MQMNGESSMVATVPIYTKTRAGQPQGRHSSSTGGIPQQSSGPGVLSRLLGRISLSKSGATVEENIEPVIPVKRWKNVLRQFGRKAAGVADVGASIAEAVPVLGVSVKGALEASIKVQRIFERRFQNVEEIEQLVHRLQCLEQQLGKYSQSEHTEWLISRLSRTEKALCSLVKRNGLDHADVTMSISQCEKDISFFLDQFSAVGHVKTQELVRERNDHLASKIVSIESQVKQQAEQLALQARQMSLLVSMMTKLVSMRIWIIDPFGKKQEFPQIPSSYEALGREILHRYSGDRSRSTILEQYMGLDKFELSRYDDHEASSVAQQDLISLGKDSTVIMRIVRYRETRLFGHGFSTTKVNMDCGNPLSVELRGKNTEKQESNAHLPYLHRNASRHYNSVQTLKKDLQGQDIPEVWRNYMNEIKFPGTDISDIERSTPSWVNQRIGLVKKMRTHLPRSLRHLELDIVSRFTDREPIAIMTTSRTPQRDSDHSVEEWTPAPWTSSPTGPSSVVAQSSEL